LSRIAYVNGRYKPFARAAVHVEDRGYQFADGVYEVCELLGGALIDERRHLERLQRSLRELSIAMPMPVAALSFVLREVVRRNRVRNGMVYVQITRGVARRDHGFPVLPVRPSVVVTARALDQARIERSAEQGIAVITLPDNRWGRVDIKTIGLLPNVLAREAAKAAGANDAWFVDEQGAITEATASNAWIVTAEGVIRTRPGSNRILTGITLTTLKLALPETNWRLEERAFTRDEALAAREAFVTSATQTVMPEVRIDGKPVGDGRPGPVATALRAEFHRTAEIAP
jgi:D-alanine transaminase